MNSHLLSVNGQCFQLYFEELSNKKLAVLSRELYLILDVNISKLCFRTIGQKMDKSRLIIHSSPTEIHLYASSVSMQVYMQNCNTSFSCTFLLQCFVDGIYQFDFFVIWSSRVTTYLTKFLKY